MLAAITLAAALAVPPPEGCAPASASAFRAGVARVTYVRASDQVRMEGFLGIDGHWVVPPAARDAGPQVEGGYLRVQDGRGWRFLDPQGNQRFMVRQPHVLDVHEGRVAFAERGLFGGERWGFMDTDGRVAVAARYDHVGDFDHGVAIVQQGARFGLIDRDGAAVLAPTHAFVKIAGDGLVAVTDDGKTWLADVGGQRAVARDFAGVGAFRGGRGVVVEVGDPPELMSVVDRQGTPLGQPRRGLGAAFEGGMLAFQAAGKWGFLDAEGEVAIKPAYQFAFPFTEGLAAVQQDGKWGYVDPAGEVVLPFGYAAAAGFGQGLAAVRIGDRAAYVDKYGQVRLELGTSAQFAPN